MMLGMSHSGASGKDNDDDKDPNKKMLDLSSHKEETGDEAIFEAALAAVALQKAAKALEKAPITDMRAIEAAMAQVLEVWQSNPILQSLGKRPLVPRPNHQLGGYNTIAGLIQKLTFPTQSVCNEEAGQALTAAVQVILQTLYTSIDGSKLSALKLKVVEALRK